jgi:hypothetical protein
LKAIKEPARVTRFIPQLSSPLANNAPFGHEKLRPALWVPCASLARINQEAGVAQFYYEIIESVLALLLKPLAELEEVIPQ